jgi:hypothetical protein
MNHFQGSLRHLATIRLNDCLFSEPVHFAGFTLPRHAGLFAVFINDPHWAPKPFQPLCLGEFGNNAPVSALLGNYDELLAAANGKTLLISVCPMPFSTTAQRAAIRDELAWAYNPVCQAEKSLDRNRVASPNIAQHLLENEPRREKELLQEKPPRRRIGFMPDCDSVR